MASRAIHPGEHLAEELGALDMSAAELARRLKVPTNRVTAIMNGQRAISGDTALRLAHFFGTSPHYGDAAPRLRVSVRNKLWREGLGKRPSIGAAFRIAEMKVSFVTPRDELRPYIESNNLSTT